MPPVTNLKTRALEAQPDPDALARARRVVFDAVDALTLVSRNDYESADAALKRLLFAVEDARKALAPRLVPPMPPAAPGTAVRLDQGEWA